MNDALLRLLLIIIAGVTVISGLSQMIAPEFVLGIIGGDASVAVQHTFATVGMFMVITGAMFLQSLLRQSTEPAIPLWIGVQKILAAGLVYWGVQRGVFGNLALGVAAFDLVSGLFAFWFVKRLGK